MQRSSRGVQAAKCKPQDASRRVASRKPRRKSNGPREGEKREVGDGESEACGVVGLRGTLPGPGRISLSLCHCAEGRSCWSLNPGWTPCKVRDRHLNHQLPAMV